MKILVVDDDDLVLKSCQRILEGPDVTIHTARNADNAKALLEAGETFDLILTDIKMPGKDGFALLSLAREKYPETVIVMMTGYLIPETIQKGSQRGADGFIAKPFTPEELMEAIHKALPTIKDKT